ncbi:PH domain-containing protein [Methanopyrus sp.]
MRTPYHDRLHGTTRHPGRERNGGHDRSPGVRLLGFGSVFGYVGLYWVKGVGRCYVYSRRQSRLAVLETDRGTVLVGAEPTEELLDALTR